MSERGRWLSATRTRVSSSAGEAALREKVAAQGWCGEQVLHGLAALPQAVPQGHRWHLFKAHMRGHLTTSRLRHTGIVQGVERCPFCQTAEDSMEHIVDCDTVREALATVTADAGAAPPDWNMRDLYLQRHSTGERRALMIACLAAV